VVGVLDCLGVIKRGGEIEKDKETLGYTEAGKTEIGFGSHTFVDLICTTFSIKNL